MFELQGGGSPLSGFERARGVLAAGKKVTARLLFAFFQGKDGKVAVHSLDADIFP